MKRPLLISSLALIACGPGTLNDNQRQFLVEDATLAASSLMSFVAAARVNDFLYDSITLDPALTAEGNAGRMAARVEESLQDCAGRVVTLLGDTLWVTANCTVQGIALDLFVSATPVMGSAVGVDIRYSGSTWDGIALPRDAWVSFPAGAAPVLAAEAGRDTLSFQGGVGNPSGNQVTLNGTGFWTRMGGDRLPLTVTGVQHFGASCAPALGRLTIGPRDVMLTSAESIPVKQVVRFSSTTPELGGVKVDLGEDALNLNGRLTLPEGC